MTDQPGDSGRPPAQESDPGTTTPRETPESPQTVPGANAGMMWIYVATGVIGVLTVLLVGTMLVVTRSGPPSEPKATASPAPTTPTATKPAAAEGSTNIECDGTFIVEIARSTTESADAGVEKAAAEARGGKFLDGAASCSTYADEGVRRVAYVGPFDTLAAACAARVKHGDVGAVLHRMNADQRGHSYCACRNNPALPVLQADAGTDGDVATLLLVSEVQRMLKELGFFKPKIAGDPFGPRTISAVQAFQTDRQLFASGVVDQQTWTALRRSKGDGGRPFC